MKKINMSNRLSGRYDIIEQIGIGGMSYVYKAFDVKRKKIVAIKMLKEELVIDEELVEKFKTEALACKDIKHENVICAYDVVDEGNMHYIVMEYVEGISLNKYIKDKGKLSNEETIKLSLQIAKGIEAAHKKGIIHRDIKPQNIVISDKNIVKITDFGIARAITSTTKNISVVGTVHYISPEQVRNGNIDFRSDIYSLGCTIYEMITGIVPFTGDKPLEIIISHLRENIKMPHIDNPNIYKSLEKIILKATRMIPRERYQTIGEMINDLSNAISDKEGTYISDSVYDDDDEGKTVIISDEDMKVIKAVSEKFTNKNAYIRDNNDLTPEQKEFFNRYIKNNAYSQHLMFKKIALCVCGFFVILTLIIFLIVVDTRKTNEIVASDSIAIESLSFSITGVDYDLAKDLIKNYGISFKEVSYEFSDEFERNKIIRITNNNIEVDNTLDIVISKGPFVIDLSDRTYLNNTKWTDMLIYLDERDLKYSISEINDVNVPRGYIIGANKKNTGEPGELIFTISRGISDQIKVMPDLYNKSLSEAEIILFENQLVLGDISYRRDFRIEEDRVIHQSIASNEEVRAGSTIDITLSAGKDGEEFIASKEKYWYSELSTTYRVVRGNEPLVDTLEDTMIIQVRLMQLTNKGIVYTELLEPEEYKIGTILPLVFPEIKGEEKIQNGQVQIVDVVNDKVLTSIDILFWPKGGE